MTPEKPDGIMMVTDVLTVLNRKRVFEFAADRIPAMYEHPSLVRDGGLMAYGPDAAETANLIAGLIDRILTGGSKPAELPVEAADEVRAGHQPQDRECARPHRPALDPRPRRRGD